MTTLRFVVLLHLVLLGCGCSDESPAESPATGEPKAHSENTDEAEITEESRAVIDLIFIPRMIEDHNEGREIW